MNVPSRIRGRNSAVAGSTSVFQSSACAASAASTGAPIAAPSRASAKSASAYSSVVDTGPHTTSASSIGT